MEVLSSPGPDVFCRPAREPFAVKRLLVGAFGSFASNGDSEILFDGVVQDEDPNVVFIEDSAFSCSPK